MENSKYTNLNFLIHSYNHADASRKVSTKTKRNTTRKLSEKQSTCHLCNKQFTENDISKPLLLDHMGHRFQLCPQCEMPYNLKFSLFKSGVDKGNVLPETCNTSFPHEVEVIEENDNVVINEEIPFENESTPQGIQENVPQKHFFTASIALKRKVDNEQPSCSSNVKIHCSTTRQLRSRKRHQVLSDFGREINANDKIILSTNNPSDAPKKVAEHKACENILDIDNVIIADDEIANEDVNSTCEPEPLAIDRQKACHGTFKAVNHVNHHNMHPSTSKKPCTCEDCTKAFNLKLCNNQCQITRKIENLYVCQICRKRFSRLWLLKTHVVVHSWDEQSSSEICNKEIIKKPTLIKHLGVHTSKSYACQICQKRFLYWLHLQQHLRCAHGEDKANKCTDCKSGFYTENELKGHLCKNDYACYPCNKQFTRKEHLNTHNSIHICKEPYSCEICKKSFILKSNFDRHLLIHTQLNKTTIPNKTHIPEKTNRDKYACPSCSQNFPQKSLLRRHVLGHKRKTKRNLRELVYFKELF